MSWDSTWATPVSPPGPAPGPSPSVPSTPQISDGPTLLGGGDFLGNGLYRPLRRAKASDFATAHGTKLIAASIGQILGTRSDGGPFQGELPWRTEFGSRLYMLRHRANDATTRELARAAVVEALQRWEPRAHVTDVSIDSEEVVGLGEVAIGIRVRFDVLSQNTAANAVLLPGVEASIPLG